MMRSAARSGSRYKSKALAEDGPAKPEAAARPAAKTKRRASICPIGVSWPVLSMSDARTRGFDANGIRRPGFRIRLGRGFARSGLARPDVKPAVVHDPNLPGAPNAFALTEAAIEHLVRPKVAFGPVTLARRAVITAADEKAADIVHSVTTQASVGKVQMQLHAVPVPGPVIVKTLPGAGRE